MTDIPDYMPEGLGDKAVDPNAPHPNECAAHRSKREYLENAEGTPFQEMSKALVAAAQADAQTTIEMLLRDVNPKHPTVACAAMSYFLHFVEQGLIKFGSNKQHDAVCADVLESLRIFAHLADPDSLPD